VTPSRRLRILLVSPAPGLDPPNGDVTYTEALLRHRPANIEYELYPDAIRAGRVRELARRGDVLTASGPERVRAAGRTARERALNTLRQRGVLFREPFRYFAVRARTYDLVHCHVFNAAFPGLDAPLVVSASGTVENVYLDGFGWSRARVLVASRVDAAAARWLRVQHTSHRMREAAVVVCQTRFYRDELIRRGAAEPDRLRVAPFFAEPGPRRAAPERPSTIGFVATEFVAKGGEDVVTAFARVRRLRPDAKLIIVGSQPQMTPDGLTRRGITWMPRVPRAELLANLVPRFDAFAYPTRFDSFSFTTLEAMAHGIPVVTSDYGPMPEVVGEGFAGRVIPRGDVAGLADELVRLLDPEENRRVRARTAEWFDAHYSPAAAMPKLVAAYEAALGVSAASS
jgi:glycosyltransferase involved in cell wall biosynthesis